MQGKKTGGRKKGSKNKVKAADILRAGLASVPDTSVVLASKSSAPVVARPGIDAVNLLTESMRSAWEASYRKANEANDAAVELRPLELAALAATEEPARLELMAKVTVLRERVTNLRLDAGKHASNAREIAVQLAPYTHPKLQAMDSKIKGNLVIELKKNF